MEFWARQLEIEDDPSKIDAVLLRTKMECRNLERLMREIEIAILGGQ
jgi:hypothetical protein